MKAATIAAFRAVCDGYSADRVVTDPEINAQYLISCRDAGLTEPDKELNKGLLNARKAGWLSGSGRSRVTTFRNLEDFSFAAEVAARFLEQRHSTSLDDILCDPVLATELDRIAAEIAPGFSSLQYRWATLYLRKNRRLKPELLSRVVIRESIDLGSTDGMDTSQIPAEQGIYIFYGPSRTLYVGEAIHLRRRVEKHLDHSDNKGLARWFWENGILQVKLEVRTLDHNTDTRVRKALESELIRSRHPLFNVQQ